MFRDAEQTPAEEMICQARAYRKKYAAITKATGSATPATHANTSSAVLLGIAIVSAAADTRQLIWIKGGDAIC